MRVGNLGKTPFIVSDSTIRTINNLVHTGSATYAVHQRVGKKELPEFTGIPGDGITFDLILSEYLGVSPKKEKKRLWRAKDRGEALRFSLGNEYYGKFVITNLSAAASAYDADIGVSSMTLTTTLLEYPEG